LFQKTIESVADAIFVLGSGGPPTIIDCNRGAKEMFGYTRQEMLFRTTKFLHISEVALEEFQKHLNPAMREEGVFHLTDFAMKRKDGTTFHAEHTVVPLNNEEGLVVGWVSVVRDITESKRTERALQRERERAQSYLDLAGVMFVAINREGRSR
jgi:PAS domain S-box-containing protein